MRAARFHGQKDIRIEDVPEPQLRPGAVKLKVAWCGICGTDLHEYLEGPIFIPSPGHPHPLSHEDAPVTLGHEFSGTVEAIGEGVTHIAVGDNVVVEPYFVCDECTSCKAGNYHLCTKMGFIGLAGGGGGLSEKVVVDRRWVHKIGDIPLDQAALIEPLSVAHHAVIRGGAKAGDVALIGGAGPIGLLVAAILKSMGVRTIVTELSEARKEKARSSGVADHVLDPSSEDVKERVLELDPRHRRRHRIRVCRGQRRTRHAARFGAASRRHRQHIDLGPPSHSGHAEAGTQGDRPAWHHRLCA